MKIVINDCFGGFGLSDEAFELYLTKKGQTFFKKESRFFTHYYKVPSEEYEKVQKECEKNNKGYKEANDLFLSQNDIERDDKTLIEVVEDLGEKADGFCARLKIVDIPDGTDWEIEEYDGLETIAESHRTWN